MKDVLLNPALDHIAVYSIFAAMAVYTIALLTFVWHLSRLSSVDKKLVKTAVPLERAGFYLMILAAALHGAGVVMRGIAASRVPWANMYEFSISGSFLIVLIFMTALAVKEIRVIAAFVNAFALLVLGVATTTFYVQIKTLMPALQSYWLVIHVMVAILAVGFFSVAAGFHIFYLIKDAGWGKAIMDKFPDLKQLERIAYRFNMVGFVAWSFTLIAGAIWAERAWHRYWGWDTKEVWTFIIWTIYAGYLHANATRGWSGKRSAWLALVGFAAILFNFTIVNLFFKGLHVYSGLK